nr:MAG TPA: hypothetical protein [Caudoviricetes sp.]
MDNKDLITRFAEDCFRFEALHQEIDGLIADEVSEVLIYEYEDLANQAAEIVLKLSANGNNLGLNFYRYYVERLEYIIDYFRALLDYEETPLAEDEQDELDDEPGAEVRFEDFPAGCAFPKKPDFVIKKWAFKFTPTAKDEANAAADEPDTEEEDDNQTTESDETAGEDTPPAELDNENDTQAAESDEAADEPAAGAPISEADILLPPGVVPITENVTRCWEELTSKERAAVRETFAMWGEMNEITGRHRGGDYAEAVKELDDAKYLFSNVRYLLIKGYPLSLIHNEQNLRKRINKAIDAIPGFRESEKFKELIELYPTYKERLQ